MRECSDFSPWDESQFRAFLKGQPWRFHLDFWAELAQVSVGHVPVRAYETGQVGEVQDV